MTKIHAKKRPNLDPPVLGITTIFPVSVFLVFPAINIHDKSSISKRVPHQRAPVHKKRGHTRWPLFIRSYMTALYFISISFTSSQRLSTGTEALAVSLIPYFSVSAESFISAFSKSGPAMRANLSIYISARS